MVEVVGEENLSGALCCVKNRIVVDDRTRLRCRSIESVFAADDDGMLRMREDDTD